MKILGISEYNYFDAICQNLIAKDKEVLLSFNNLTLDWSIYDFERFPAVQWKLQKQRKLKANNPEKLKELQI